MQNGFCESFNGRMRDELLNETLFFGLDHARAKIGAWPPRSNIALLTQPRQERSGLAAIAQSRLWNLYLGDRERQLRAVQRP
jgi:hypothetical protein